jgi:hypothetical protein
MLLLLNAKYNGGGKAMTKKALIEILLVEESAEKANKEIEKEIRDELSENTHVIPWAAKIEKMQVINE